MKQEHLELLADVLKYVKGAYECAFPDEGENQYYANTIISTLILEGKEFVKLEPCESPYNGSGFQWVFETKYSRTVLRNESPDEYNQRLEEQEKQEALKKLTGREKVLLGLI